MSNISALVEKDLQIVNEIVVASMHSDVALVSVIVNYIIGAGGKRLRPVLVLLVAKALANQNHNIYKLAAGIECLHTATLLHDDVIDESSLRRGRQTTNEKWGNASSVLIGDFLYATSFQLMVEVANLEVMGILANTTKQLSQGEVFQLTKVRNIEISEQDYIKIIQAKTASLFSASAQCAAIIADADIKTVNSMYEYGYNLGMAFQLVDDILDYTGDVDELGKNIGNDLKDGKITAPLLFAMQHSNAKELREIITQTLNKNKDTNTNVLAEVIKAVQELGGVKTASELAESFITNAQASLNILPDNVYKQELILLTKTLLHRIN